MNGRPLRILALNWRCVRHPQAGGAEANLFACARSWARAGHQVTVFCADPGRAHAPERDEEADGITIVRRGGRFTVYLAAVLFMHRNRYSYDCVLDVTNGIPFFAPLFMGTPCTLFVHHLHHKQWFCEFPWPVAVVGSWIERRMVPLVYRRNTVVAVSPTTRTALLELGFLAERVRVVYSGVSQAQPAPVPSDIEASAPTIVYVGRIKRYKRVEQLVRMMPALRESVPGVRLEIAGDGDARPMLAGLIKELGVEDCVTLHGFVDDATKSALLSRATVFATPSMQEGWGLSVIEANSHGCPAVAYDVPGLSVAIRHGETGLLATDADSFAAALKLLLLDRSTRDAYAEEARTWARRFDWESSAALTLDALSATIDGSRSHMADDWRPEPTTAATGRRP